MRMFYGVNHAIINSSDGYALRGHQLARAIAQAGVYLKVIVAAAKHRAVMPFCMTIDGIDYLQLERRSEGGYRELFEVFKPDAVLAASNWSHAQPVQQAAQELGLPFWYEARGFWELSRCARDPGFATSAEFQQEIAAETAIAQAAERLFSLNRHMAAEWVRRGVPAAKISLIPNGLAAIPASIPEPDLALRDRLGLDASKVIAYIGSFSAYEGLDDLITAFAIARQQGLEARLLLVGSLSQSGSSGQPCQSSDRLFSLARQLGIADRLVFTGRVPPHTVANYYPLIDLVVIPSRPERVCEIVSPLKPLEAAAQGTQLLLSSVAPLADLQSLGPGVHLFEKGSLEALARQLVAILSRPTPPRCPQALYPRLEQFLWSRNIEPLLQALRETPPRLKRSFPWHETDQLKSGGTKL
ncbi:MAG: glycosyltransferase family 4 protein [Cyanobium sp.]